VADYPLGRVGSCLRPDMVWTMEARKAPKVNYSDIVSEFVKRKSRKMLY